MASIASSSSSSHRQSPHRRPNSGGRRNKSPAAATSSSSSARRQYRSEMNLDRKTESSRAQVQLTELVKMLYAHMILYCPIDSCGKAPTSHSRESR